jgi:hypothetical protein
MFAYKIMKKNKTKGLIVFSRGHHPVATTKEFVLAMFSLTLVFFLIALSNIPPKALELVD